MTYDFDRVIDRTGTGSVKWDLVNDLFQGSDLLPLWVADMDFASPPDVIAALEKRARHGIFGYTAATSAYYDAVIAWFKTRYAWDLKREWIHFSPGIVPALNLLIQTFTRPGDRIILQQPVYYPFMKAVRSNGREILNNPLKLEDGSYRMDFDDLKQKAQDPGVTLMILSSPHNPVGRVWTKGELEHLGKICAANRILVIADEIHCDLTYPGIHHTPFASLHESLLMSSITCLSPSKTFNLAGLQTANLIIANPELAQKYRHTMECLGIMGPNLFGAEALTAAYTHGGPWLDAVMSYISGNLTFLKAFIGENIPRIKVIEPEGTYLVWLDFRACGLDKDTLKGRMREKARVALDDGYIFGSPEGDGFMRINIACPRTTLEKAVERIKLAFQAASAL